MESLAHPVSDPDRNVAWEDFAVGRAVRSQGLTVTETHLVMWSMTCGDWYPLHTNAEFAKETRFGHRIVHGPLTLALSLGLIVQTTVFGDAVVAWLGLDEVRATAPVFIDDTITVTATVLEASRSSKPEYGKAHLGYSITNQDDAEVMTFVSGFLLTTRHA
ncbi:MAG: MaoC/PaaZ C-terminal domain-containing protein [Acidimicrobiales bacterium]